MAKRKTKRVVALGDFHCGHAVGLTPPGWQWSEVEDTDHWKNKAARVQTECWKWYVKTLNALKPIDVLIANGDLIDGSGHRSGGTEQITTNRLKQVNMAVQCLEVADAGAIVATVGTAYHTGEAEDFEEVIADAGVLNVRKIGSHEWPEVNGIVFDVKHHLGSSSIPHGRHTAIARDRLWNMLWAERDQQPRGDVFLRSHVHYHQHCGGPGWLAMTLPALQAAGTKYGARRCSGVVDYGMVHFDVTPSGAVTWLPHLAELKTQAAKVVVL